MTSLVVSFGHVWVVRSVTRVDEEGAVAVDEVAQSGAAADGRTPATGRFGEEAFVVELLKSLFGTT